MNTILQFLKRKSSYIVFFLLGCAFMYTFLNNINTKNQTFVDNSSPIRKPTTSKFIAPLLLSSENNKLYEDDAFYKTILGYINSKIKDGTASNISFYFKDLTSGIWTGVNENERYAPASLEKVPIMIATLKQSESDPSLLDKQIFYDGKIDRNTKEYYQSQKHILPNHSYSVEELISYMIMYSDNNATALLLSVTPQHNLTEIFTDLGLPIPEKDTYETIDFLSDRLYSRLFRVLYNSTYLNEENSEKALKLLSYTDFDNGIVSQVPKDVSVANKFGERTINNQNNVLVFRELHDCGIVYVPKNPYLICIMTKGDDFKKLESVIQDISKLTYDKMKK